VGVAAISKPLGPVVIGDASFLEFLQRTPDLRRLERIEIPNANGESIPDEVSAAKLIGMPIRPDDLNPRILERRRGFGRRAAPTREVNRNCLAGHRDPILHPRRTDRLFLHIEVPTESFNEFGVSQPFLLHPDVQMLTLTDRLVQRHLIDDEILVTQLDPTRQQRRLEQPALRHRITEHASRRRRRHVEIFVRRNAGWVVRRVVQPNSCSLSSSRSSSSKSGIHPGCSGG
jgi:hypothetical protein